MKNIHSLIALVLVVTGIYSAPIITMENEVKFIKTGATRNLQQQYEDLQKNFDHLVEILKHGIARPNFKDYAQNNLTVEVYLLLRTQKQLFNEAIETDDKELSRKLFISWSNVLVTFSRWVDINLDDINISSI